MNRFILGLIRLLKVVSPYLLNLLSLRSRPREAINSPISDYLIDGKTFEIGGRKKGQKQIEAADDGYVVKDDIESGYANVIPLWAFGMNY